MIIIVEGNDGVGKSTLCRELSGRLNCPVYKPNADGLVTSTDTILGHDQGTLGVAMALVNRADVIFDRSFPSQVAYSYAFRRPDFNHTLYEMMDHRLAQVPHLGVMITCPGDPVAAYMSLRERGENDLSQDEWVGVYEGYLSYLEWSQMTWVRVGVWDAVYEKIESVMSKLVWLRDHVNTKHHVFMEMARNAARRSTCLSRRQGAVIVSATGHVIAVGYNGAPVGFPHPTECERLCIGMGKELEKCNDSHAEENCIVHAALNGSNPDGGTVYTIMSPCPRCARMLINAGIKHVVYEREYDPKAVQMLSDAGLDLTRIGW